VVTALAIAARVVLGVVFAVAAVAKLRDREGTRTAVVDFGVPRRLAGAVATALPLAELAVACLLLPAQTAAYGAVGALVLLGIFSAAIAWNLARGRTPDCHCFGQLHSTPAGWRTLARNGVLAGIAVFALFGVIAEPDASAIAWTARLDGSELIALVVAVAAVALLAAGGFAFLSLMRSYGSVLVRLDRVEAALAEAGIELEEEQMPEVGLEPGTPAPQFSVTSISAGITGGKVTLDSLTATGVPALLLFTSPHCKPCSALLPTAAEWQHTYADDLTIAFVSDGSLEEVQAEAEEFELDRVLLDDDRLVSDAYRASGTPAAVLVAPDGTIASWIASGGNWIERLVRDATAGGSGAKQGLPLGTEAPALELPSLDGERVSLTDLRGRDALLLFWNPECGFCREMHDSVIEWEKSANGVTPQLVIVSSGDVESTRAEGFASRVLLDEDFEAGPAFHANGTPMAVLLDADGRVASEVAAGAEGVLSLANGHA
jgi:thiol-disulfide isomerase/thioredoxin